MTNVEILEETKALVFDACNFTLSTIFFENESLEYCACKFEINKLKAIFRVAKITPTKTGQFVTLWKRNKNEPIQPFDDSDAIDLVIINTKTECGFGQFVFPKNVLIEKGVMTNNLKEGKRAIRVYPPWDITTSNQAKKTQNWQLNYFLEIPKNQTIDLNRVKLLYLL